jgi:predicted transcriptional regulator
MTINLPETQRQQKILLLLALKSANTKETEVIKALSERLLVPKSLILDDINQLIAKGLLQQSTGHIYLSPIPLTEDS